MNFLVSISVILWAVLLAECQRRGRIPNEDDSRTDNGFRQSFGGRYSSGRGRNRNGMESGSYNAGSGRSGVGSSRSNAFDAGSRRNAYGRFGNNMGGSRLNNVGGGTDYNAGGRMRAGSAGNEGRMSNYGGTGYGSNEDSSTNGRRGIRGSSETDYGRMNNVRSSSDRDLYGSGMSRRRRLGMNGGRSSGGRMTSGDCGRSCGGITSDIDGGSNADRYGRFNSNRNSGRRNNGQDWDYGRRNNNMNEDARNNGQGRDYGRTNNDVDGKNSNGMNLGTSSDMDEGMRNNKGRVTNSNVDGYSTSSYGINPTVSTNRDSGSNRGSSDGYQDSFNSGAGFRNGASSSKTGSNADSNTGGGSRKMTSNEDSSTGASTNVGGATSGISTSRAGSNTNSNIIGGNGNGASRGGSTSTETSSDMAPSMDAASKANSNSGTSGSKTDSKIGIGNAGGGLNASGNVKTLPNKSPNAESGTDIKNGVNIGTNAAVKTDTLLNDVVD